MYASFLQIVRDHRARYPLMQPQDYGKLAFQSEYGPKHLAGRIDEVFSALEEECGRLPAYVCPEDPEEIGGGFLPCSAICRMVGTRKEDFCKTAYFDGRGVPRFDRRNEKENGLPSKAADSGYGCVDRPMEQAGLSCGASQ